MAIETERDNMTTAGLVGFFVWEGRNCIVARIGIPRSPEADQRQCRRRVSLVLQLHV